jgi:predicted permease
MLSLLLAEKLFSLFLILGMGFTLSKTGILRVRDTHTLSALTLYGITPCLLISTFQTDSSPEKVSGFALALGVAALLSAISIGGAKICAKLMKLNAMEQTSVAYPNCGNLVFPLTAALFGAEWMFFVNAYCVVQNFLTWSHGKKLLLGEKRFDFKAFLRNPCVIAAAIGAVMFFSGLKLPQVVAYPLELTGNMIGPISMLITGILLSEVSFKQLFSYAKLPLAVLSRLIIIPASSVIILKLLKLEEWVPYGDRIVLIVLLSASAPAANFVTQMSSIQRDDAEFANLIGIASTLLCILTMPLIIAFYQL